MAHARKLSGTFVRNDRLSRRDMKPNASLSSSRELERPRPRRTDTPTETYTHVPLLLRASYDITRALLRHVFRWTRALNQAVVRSGAPCVRIARDGTPKVRSTPRRNRRTERACNSTRARKTRTYAGTRVLHGRLRVSMSRSSYRDQKSLSVGLALALCPSLEREAPSNRGIDYEFRRGRATTW